MGKNASAGNRTRVDSLEGYNSTTKPPMLGWILKAIRVENSFLQQESFFTFCSFLQKWHRMSRLVKN